jgi:hypothetical protein
VSRVQTSRRGIAATEDPLYQLLPTQPGSLKNPVNVLLHVSAPSQKSDVDEIFFSRVISSERSHVTERKNPKIFA